MALTGRKAGAAGPCVLCSVGRGRPHVRHGVRAADQDDSSERAAGQTDGEVNVKSSGRCTAPASLRLLFRQCQLVRDRWNQTRQYDVGTDYYPMTIKRGG